MTPDKSPRTQALELATTLVETQAARPDLIYSRLGLAGELLVSNQLLAEAKRVDELGATRDELRDLALEQSERIKELKGECARLKGNLSCVGIHTCHEHCEHPTCVLRKENEKLMAVVDAAGRFRDNCDCAPVTGGGSPEELFRALAAYRGSSI